MSSNGSIERLSRSPTIFSLCSISQLRPTRNDDACQDDYQRVLHSAQRHGEGEATAQRNPSVAQMGSNSSGKSNVARRTLTNLNYSSMYPTAKKLKSAKDQSENLPLNNGERFRTTISRFWLWEILAYLFSFACMGAVIAILAFEDGKQVDQWGFRITPNAVVSFVATLAKSSFLLVTAETIGQLKWLHYHGKSHKLSDMKIFDEASRGPLGSFKLLMSKNKSTLLASIAAFIVLGALFVDPFVQLVFSFPSRRTAAPTQDSSFQIATIYDPNRSMLNHAVSPAYMVDARMLAAFLRGLYSGVARPEFSCPSGNCTWTDLTTLGICGECEDITNQIEVNCPGWYTPQNSSHYYLCKYTMPSNHTLDGWLMSPAPAHTMWNSSAVQIDMLSSMDATFAQIEAIQLSDVITAADGTQVLPSPKASRCTFSFCTKTYTQIDVTNGVLSIPTPQESILKLGSRSNESCLPSKCTTPLYQTMVSQSLVSHNHVRTNYSINYADREYITEFLINMFDTGWGDLGLSDVTQYGRPLAYSQDLNQTIKSIAASMTEVIRTGPNSTTEVGISYIERTFVVIRWSYLAYPIALVLLTMVVLIAVIIETTRHGVIAWKNSALALVLHELKGWEMPAPMITNVQELDRMAVRMKAILVDGGKISASNEKD